jgi:uncharacterized repeat protein (TIGR01451 family)
MKRTRLLLIIIPLFFVLVMLAYAKAKSHSHSQPLPAQASTVKPVSATHPPAASAPGLPLLAPTPPNMGEIGVGGGSHGGPASLALDGSGSYVLVPNSPSLDITGPVTVEAWIKTNSIAQESIVERGRWNGDVDGGYALRLSEEGKIQFYTIRSSNDNDFVTGDTVVNPGEWHHVTGVFDGAQLRVYLDGTLDGSKASTIAPAGGTSDLRIGAGADGDGYFFDGLIDNARVTAGTRYTHSFSPDREPLDCAIDLQNPETGCRGVWLFFSESTDDSSGFENHGALQGKNGAFSSETNAELGELGQPQSPDPSATTGLKVINFDELGNRVNVNDHYPDIKFVAASFPAVTTFIGVDIGGAGSSPPNIIHPDNNGNLSMDVSFPRAVDGLSFNIIGQDDFGTICIIDVFRGNQLLTTRSVPGEGRTNRAIPINIGSEFNQVTEVIIRNITDTAGLGYDDFRFTIPDPIPPAPTNLVATPQSNQIALSWNASNGAASYKVKRSNTSGGPYTTIATVTTTGFSDFNATKGVTYFYVVSAVSSGGESGNSNQSSARMPNPPLPPANLTSRGGSERVFLNWVGSAGATSYNVKRLIKHVDSSFITIGSTAALSFVNTGLSNKVYQYVVTAVNSDGESGPSNVTEQALSKCSDSEAVSPAPQQISSVGWTFTVEASENDGIVLRDIALDGRLMAKMFSIPYFTIKTNKMPAASRGELARSNETPFLRSKLISLKVLRSHRTQNGVTSEAGVKIVGHYVIDRLSPESQSCVFVDHIYSFTDALQGCEFSSTLECARFYPEVSYSMSLRDGEQLESITFPQRFHVRVNNQLGNAIGIFRDCNLPPVHPGGVPGCGLSGFIFSQRQNPLLEEYGVRIIDRGRDLQQWDNIHQTFKDRVREPVPEDFPSAPTVVAGCPECFHTHWRWGTFTARLLQFFGLGSYGGGNLLMDHTSQRDVDIAFVRQSDAITEVDPFDYQTLYSPPQPLLKPNGKPEEVVIWYASTGHQFSDKFFTHGGFFGTSRSEVQKALVETPAGGAPLNLNTTTDGPESIRFGRVYQDGGATFQLSDPNSIGPLPSIYSPFNNLAYTIRSSAIVSGPHTVRFVVPSVSDQTLFNNLRILEAEPDPFDHDRFFWVDKTILPPDVEAPNFSDRSIKARVNELGVFTIVRLNGTTAPPVGNADLAVSISDAPDPVLADTNLTYTVNVLNQGPQTATNVGLLDGLPPDADFVSVSPASECEYDEGSVICHLGSLNSGASRIVTIVVRPSERSGHFPPGGRTISNSAFVRSDEVDPNTANNSASQSTLAKPASNASPTITITSPAALATLPGPANISLIAAASDSDGSISKVEFFDGATLIGIADAIGGGQYRKFWNNVGFGEHTILALATDNLGKVASASPVGIFINGTAVIRITSPSPGTVLPPSVSTTITASVSLPPGTINKVEFFANDQSLGQATATGGDQFSLTWADPTNGSYLLAAIVTDNNQIDTVSSGVPVIVTHPPSVSITAPADGANFPAAANINLVAGASDLDGSVSRVDFFANGSFIGSGLEAGNGFSYLWNNVSDGIYSITAAAVDDLGATTRSDSVNIAVNTPGLIPGELIWFDDAPPQGAGLFGKNDWWEWLDANPGSFSGTKAHQSRIANGFHEHGFEFADFKLALNANDKLYTYVFLSPGFKPQEMMLGFKDQNGSWEHRAYWTDKAEGNWINMGTDGTNGRRRMGQMPAEGRWVRLEIPVADVGLAGQTLTGMTFMLYGGRATFDRTGKTNHPTPTTPPPADSPWFDDALPSGAIQGQQDDVWDFISSNPSPFSGTKAHRSFVATSGDQNKYRAHFFTGATQTMAVDAGDTLYTYVYMDPTFTPDELVVGWHDGSNWHRAYWGASWVLPGGRYGTESMRFMGGLPQAGAWVRLEVPASYVGLEGKIVSGMYFGMDRQARRGLATWDVSGKSTVPPSSSFEPLFATIPIHQFFNNDEGYTYFVSEKQRSGSPLMNKWFVHTNQAPGTIPIYRMRNSGSHHFILTPNPGLAGPGWDVDPSAGDGGVPFYIYPNGGTPETTKLHSYRGQGHDYYYTIDPNDLAINGRHYEGPIGWVHPTRSVMSPQANPIDDPKFFVQQHYSDFLSREPDTNGLNFWVNSYNECPSNNFPCIDDKRNNISAAFFLSIEFQETGYFVYRYRKASFNAMPRRQQLYDDKAIVSQGVVVGTPGWEDVLAANKAIFSADWVGRPEFGATFNSLSNTEYVDRLYANAGITPDPQTRTSLINGLNATTLTRESVLRTVVDTPAFITKEYNPAFVLMEYFGYLQRNPDDPPNNDFSGFNFWLNKLNEHNGNYIAAEMVKSFLVSGEYRGRFGQPAAPSSAAVLTVGSNISAKVGNLAGKFSTVSTEGLMKVEGLYPWSVDQPPTGYTFFKNLAWKVTSTSNTSPPYTLTANIPWEVASAADFAKLRIFSREGNAWVDRTILAPDSPAPDFNGRTLSARVDTLSTVIVAHEGSMQTSLSISSPSNGAAFNAPASISINTTSYDPDGVIDKVEFYNGSTLIGEDTSAPYSLSWSNVDAGTYSITARALDNMGVNLASASLNVTVNGLPSVIIMVPQADAVFETPANVPIEAYASSSLGISKVEFFNGATKLSEDSTAPYTFNWNSVGVGSYNLTAKATDSANLTATSSPVSITVVNTPPTVSITSPANGANLGNAPASVVITANAADSHGIKNVEFFKNGVSLGIDTTAPYSFSWNNVPVGTFNLTAKATDNLDAFTLSAPVSVEVTNAPPSVSITAPAPNTAYTAPASITINATAADNEGISKVEFFQNSTKLGEDTTAPYSFTWANAGSGTYSLTAKATDGQNATTTSSAVNVTVNAPPSITLIAPANGATYIAPAGVAPEAAASDSDGVITQVEFFQNGASIGIDTSAPYSVSWAHVPFGSYALTARATDDRGATVTSNVVNITVNPASTVLITSPSNNAVFIAGSTVTFNANATDADGVSKVEFFQGSTKLGEDTSAPYSFDWTDVAAGDYSLTARATDTLGEITNSAAMSISVLPQVKQFVGWSSVTNGLDLGNGSVRKTSTGAWDFSASSLQKLLPGDGYFESTAANYNQSIGLSGSDGASRALVIGSGGWAAIYENGQEVAATCCRIPSETISPHAAGDRYRIEITNSVLRYVRYRAAAREVMFTSTAALPAYPISLGLGLSPQDAEWQKTVLAQLTRKVTWSSIVNGVDLGNGSVRKTSTGTWDFSASAKQTLLRGDGYFESTASYWNHSININGANGAGNSLVLGTGGWAAIYENGQEVANTSPLGNITPHLAGDRYRLEITSGVLRYVRYRSGVRAVLYTSTNPLPAYPLSFSLGASFQNSEWQNTVIAQLSQTVAWSYINNGIDLGNGSVRKTSTGTWDFSAGPRQQLVYGNGYFESTASYWNHSINLAGSDGAGGALLAGTGGWAAIYENGQEVANTSPLGNIAPHASGDRYRLEISCGKLRYVRYRASTRSIMFTSANALPAYATAYSLGASFQNSEWQNTVFSDNVPEHNDASFVSQSVPATMASGQTYSVTVTMRNTGASTWTPDGDYQLASENQPDNQRWGISRVNLNSVVLPGADGTFTFTVTAPATGTHSFQWRMVQQGVERFGALSTNVNVQTSGSAPAPSGENSTSSSEPTNAAPFAAITLPSSGASFATGAMIALEASAYDTDGVVIEVEFFADGKSLGVAKSAPYKLSWSSVPEGTYILTVRATDDRGSTTTSNGVNIVVRAPSSTKLMSRQLEKLSHLRK